MWNHYAAVITEEVDFNHRDFRTIIKVILVAPRDSVAWLSSFVAFSIFLGQLYFLFWCLRHIKQSYICCWRVSTYLLSGKQSGWVKRDNLNAITCFFFKNKKLIKLEIWEMVKPEL
ncbi:hypothetical protein L6164_024080 [Bauhinia variegata]|uniref:Uncharacterized protein n=1 Tax=Bauhinia variegata TaxID=167791 RepID=A0ACB9LWC6_BAUVA|nr:hypothetical protein L6164_024080 [Bauhinia variegata]